MKKLLVDDVLEVATEYGTINNNGQLFTFNRRELLEFAQRIFAKGRDIDVVHTTYRRPDAKR